MLEEGVGETTFLHKSIAEYHAAAFVKSCDDDFQVDFYKIAKTDYQQWKECLIFLEAIDPLRFSKFYAKEILDDNLYFLENLLNTKNMLGFVEALKKGFSGEFDCDLIYRYSTIVNSSECFPTGAMAILNENNLYLANFYNTIIETIFKNFTKITKISEVEGLIKKGIAYKKNDEEFGLMEFKFIDEFIFEKIIESTKTFKQKLELIRVEKEGDITRIKNRKMIFSRSNIKAID